MARFKRLTWDDLDNLTRAELVPRLEAEQGYWARKEQRGLGEADLEARKEFNAILAAAINPTDVSQALSEITGWLAGERPTGTSYWDEKPGPADGLTQLGRLRAYLAAKDWRRPGHTWRGATVWAHDDSGQVISVPDTVHHDVALRIRDAVEGIARAEGRSPAEVEADLSNA